MCLVIDSQIFQVLGFGCLLLLLRPKLGLHKLYECFGDLGHSGNAQFCYELQIITSYSTKSFCRNTTNTALNAASPVINNEEIEEGISSRWGLKGATKDSHTTPGLCIDSIRSNNHPIVIISLNGPQIPSIKLKNQIAISYFLKDLYPIFKIRKI